MREKALKLLGLMRRANAIRPGEDRAGEAVQAGRAMYKSWTGLRKAGRQGG